MKDYKEILKDGEFDEYGFSQELENIVNDPDLLYPKKILEAKKNILIVSILQC
jgi:hypothetical protein